MFTTIDSLPALFQPSSGLTFEKKKQLCYYSGAFRGGQIISIKNLHGFFNFLYGPVRENLSGKSTLKLVIAKFESDTSLASEDKALQSRKILQTFVWWEAQTCPPPYKGL